MYILEGVYNVNISGWLVDRLFSPAFYFPPFCCFAARLLSEPFHVRAEVIHGFGRGSRELGIPTANLDMTVVEACLGEGLENGVYFGLAEKGGEVFDSVLSFGYNPFYNNDKRTMVCFFPLTLSVLCFHLSLSLCGLSIC